MLRFFLKLVLYVPFKLIFWTKWQNKRELRQYRGRPVILAMQHRSGLDGPIIVVDVWRKTNFWVKAETFSSKFTRWFFKQLGCIPVRENAELALMRSSKKVLEARHLLTVMPQGHRSFDVNENLQIQNGVAMVALHAGVPIIPVVTDRAFRPFRLTRVKVGTAIDVKQYLQDGRMTKDSITQLGADLSHQMLSMLVGFAKPVKLKAWQSAPNVIGRGIVIRDHKLLAIERHRNGEDYYVFPGGHVDPGETLAQTCAREVMEETGVTVRPFRELYKFWYEDPVYGRGNGWQTFMACEYQSGEPHETDAEEYTDPERKGGIYKPVWLAMDDLKKVDLRPSFVKEQLYKDYLKKGARLPFPLRRLRGNGK